MIQVEKIDSIDELSELKEQYIQLTTAPLDGMWLCGFVPMASHYGIYSDSELVGFFCVNDENYLLQFFVHESYQHYSSQLFASIVDGEHTPSTGIKGAFASTAEPSYLSLCLDNLSKYDINALMYQKENNVDHSQLDTSLVIKLEAEQLERAVDFAVANIGAPSEWLTGYYANLIKRQELYGVWHDGRLLATGERRGYDEYQLEYADIGVIVDESMRGKGLATQVLQSLDAMNELQGLKSICSTEKSNLAAQKAIGRAGFFASNRIVQFHA